MKANKLESDVWYPAEEVVPETLLHFRIRTLLWHLVQRHLAGTGRRALTGSDQFIYWEEGNNKKSIAPDVYVVLGEDPHRGVRVWKTWEESGAPDLVVEIVSNDVRKDYVLGPSQYDSMGVQELIVYDPNPTEGRVRWQVYRRDEGGGLVPWDQTSGDRVHSQVLDCMLREVMAPEGEQRIRLGTGPDGETLLLAAEEAEWAERAQKEAERAQKEAERAQKEAERARRIELEAEVAELRRRLQERGE